MIMLLLILITIFVLIAISYPAYLKSVQQAARKQKLLNSKLVVTASGFVEFATAGQGIPVLAIHGAGGGYDQGITSCSAMLGKEVKIIAPSRFGYQGSSMPGDASPEKQADVYAHLLDELGIDKVFVLGISAGGPSSIRFALKYPDRTLGLILIVPLCFSPGRPRKSKSVSLPFIVSSILRTGYPLWLGIKLFPSSVLSTIGVPRSIQKLLTKEEKSEIMNWMLPYTPRIKGLINDAVVANSLQAWPVENIKSPVLIFSAKDDPWNTFDPGLHLAGSLPNAKFIGFETGGHLLYGRDEKVRKEIKEFIQQHVPTSSPHHTASIENSELTSA